jgi:hypothetical protein
MSHRSRSASKRDAVSFRQRTVTFIDKWKPIGVGAVAVLGAAYTVYDLFHRIKERKLEREIVQNERDASNANLRQIEKMNRIEEETARIEQRRKLEEIGQPKLGLHENTRRVERYQELWQRQLCEEEDDERPGYENEESQAFALGPTSSRIIVSTEFYHTEETSPWEERHLATGMAAVRRHNEERDSESKSAGERRSHRSHRHSSRGESEYSRSSSRHGRSYRW